jgi:hypothetical protein
MKVYELYIPFYNKNTYTIIELIECEEMNEIIKEVGHCEGKILSFSISNVIRALLSQEY